MLCARMYLNAYGTRRGWAAHPRRCVQEATSATSLPLASSPAHRRSTPALRTTLQPHLLGPLPACSRRLHTSARRHSVIARSILTPDDMSDIVHRMVSLSGLATASSALAGALQRRVASRALSQEVCRALQLSGPGELQDTLAALLLSECAYKKVRQ